MTTSLANVSETTSDLPSLFRLAEALSQAPGFIPSHLKSVGEIVAVILAGRELGLPPMASMRSIALIRGKVILDASMQLALMVRAGAKVKWLRDGTDGQVAELEVTRPGHEPYVSRYSLEMAQRAGIAGSDTWRKHTAAMLRARCVSAAGKAYMPDVLSGCYVPGELPGEADSVVTEGGGVVVPFPQPAVEPAVVMAEHEQPETLEPGERQTIASAFGMQLRALKTEAEMVGWMRKVIEAQFEQGIRQTLWRMYRHQAVALKLDANLLARKAQQVEVV
jgi:hypothetical protein